MSSRRAPVASSTVPAVAAGSRVRSSSHARLAAPVPPKQEAAPTRAKSRSPRRAIQPAHHLTVAPDAEYPFALLAAMPVPAAASASRSSSRTRGPADPRAAPSASPINSQPPTVRASQRRGHSHSEQYAALQAQHARMSSPPPTARASPATNVSPRRAPSVSAASTQRSATASRAPSVTRPHRSPVVSRSHSRAPSRVHADTLDDHELAVLASEAAANAPPPLSPSRTTSPFPYPQPQPRRVPSANVALQSDLNSLDYQIRQSTQELLHMQQQQQASQLQQQLLQEQEEALYQQQQQQPYYQQHQQQPYHHSASSSQHFQQYAPPLPHDSRSSSVSLVESMPSSSPLSSMPTPMVSRNNPFVSLVDAIDNVLAKSTASGRQTPAYMPHALQQQDHYQPQQHDSHSYQQPWPQPKSHLQLVSESRTYDQSAASTLSPPNSHSNTLNSLMLTADDYARPASASTHGSFASTMPSSLHMASGGNYLEEDLSETPREEFDEHPELAGQGNIEALKLSNLLLRDKGALLLKKHGDLRLKFKAVRSLLTDLSRRKDHEVAMLRIAALVSTKVQAKQRQAFRVLSRGFVDSRGLKEVRLAKLRSAMRFGQAAAANGLSMRLRLAFGRWKEVAIRLAMRAVQNQWMRDWEEDLRFEARRTALASVVQQAQHRARAQAAAALARKFHAWRMQAVYLRVKDIFATHQGGWNSDRDALLQLVLEANSSRESMARQADQQAAEHEALKDQLEQVAHFAAQHTDLANQVAQAQQAKRRTHERAAKVLATAVWTVRCTRARRALRRWAAVNQTEQRNELCAQLYHAQSASSSSHQQQQQQPQQQRQPVHQQSAVQPSPDQPQHPHQYQQTQPPTQHQQQPQYEPQPSLAHHQQPQPPQPMLQQQPPQPMQQPLHPQPQQQQQRWHQEPQHQSPPRQQPPQQYLPSPQHQPQYLPSPQQAQFQAYSPHRPVSPQFIAGPLQQLASSPSAAPGLLTPRTQNAFDVTLTTPQAIDAKLAEFEQAKLQLEQETVSLAARLAATRVNHSQSVSGETTPMFALSSPLQPSFAMSQPTSSFQAPPQPQPFHSSPLHQQQQQQQQQQQLRSPPQPTMATSSHQQEEVTLEQYAPPLTHMLTEGLEESFDPSQLEEEEEPQRSAPQPHRASLSQVAYAPDSPEAVADGRLPSRDEDLIQPPLVFDDAFESHAPQVITPLNGHAHDAPVVAPAVLSPARLALLASVFGEFHRSFALRSSFAASSSPSRMSLVDLAKALRKVGLRAGDLPVAKLADTVVQDLVARRGWTGRESIGLDEFNQLAQAVLTK